MPPETDAEKRLREEGFSPPPPPPPEQGIPPHWSRWAVPPHQTYAALYNLTSRSFRFTFDEAMRNSRESARAMRFDPLIYACLEARKQPVSQFPWHFEAQDDSDPAQQEGVKIMTDTIEAIDDFEMFKWELLEAVFFGRAAVQSRFGYTQVGKRQLLRVNEFYPVDGDKLVFKWNGDVGLRVNLAYWKGDHELTDLSPTHFLNSDERQLLTVAKFQPTDMGYFDGDQAGALHGLGIRGRLYWYWWTRQNIYALLTNYLERIAAGFTIYYYISGDDASRQAVQAAAEKQLGDNAILFPRLLDNPNGGPGVDRLEPSGTGFALFRQEIERLDDLIRFVILGQELTHSTGGTGLGSGVAEAHEQTFERLLRADAKMLESALNRDLVPVLARYNCPDIPCPKMIIDVDKPNLEEIMGFASGMFQMGYPIDGDYLASIGGLPKPEPGATILSQMSPMQPAAVGAIPQGVPMAGDAQLPQGAQAVDQNGQPVDPSQMQPQQGQPQAVPGVQGIPSRQQRKWKRPNGKYLRNGR